jgi:hypothetical protein
MFRQKKLYSAYFFLVILMHTVQKYFPAYSQSGSAL